MKTLIPPMETSVILSGKSLISHQFVKRVNSLRNAYRWDDRKVIFAVQQKMLGAGRYWVRIYGSNISNMDPVYSKIFK